MNNRLILKYFKVKKDIGMDVLLRIAYVLLSIIIGLYIYTWSSTFKKLGWSTIEELNEGEESEEEIVNESETRIINYFGITAFLIIGIIVWTLLGITIGKIASDITDNWILKWIVYVIIYFAFLRIPFGVGNRIVKRSYEFEGFPEKIVFSIMMISSYIISICCYENLPQILKWHLKLLN